jgi:hemolysin-activating ACP:hemolysin acyltransferase
MTAEQAVQPARAANNRISAGRMQALIRSAAFGEIVGILMLAPRHKRLTLEALRLFVLPAILNNQYMIARVNRPGAGGAVPSGLALWASVSDEVDQRLRANAGAPVKLTAAEWKSGANLWLVDLIAPPAITGSLLKGLEDKVAKGRPMAAQITSKDGKAHITTIKELIGKLPKTAA